MQNTHQVRPRYDVELSRLCGLAEAVLLPEYHGLGVAPHRSSIRSDSAKKSAYLSAKNVVKFLMPPVVFSKHDL